MNTINEKLRHILIDFEIDDRLIPDEALFSDDLGIPYRKIIKLSKRIERGFSVKAPVSPQHNWNSIADIRNYLHTHIHYSESDC
ncbi:hypothetical protein [Xanthocytophaga agilis]|uniref:Acyl carrier protein n=1 Tax=Xanthocytophaga agilis TaxID=3048010 RepID=A0AAE3R326_9BACT|nr:hypothetical protein [Xanthocytophaga agilis]MDJ1502250.1 hypothetical protein [Xanthocytophaga agilis]